MTQVFLETQRLLLRRFTQEDSQNLVELDSDPEVMRFINGGRATPCDEIENDILPAFRATTNAMPATASGRRWRSRLADSPAGSTFGPRSVRHPASWSSAIGYADRPGARGMQPKAREP